MAQVADGNVSPQLGVGSATPTPGAGASVFVPIDPARVYDSRLAGPGGTPDPIPGNHGSRVMSVADAIDVVTGRVLQRNVVPAGASAVAFNLTATETQSRGWFAITPGDASTYSASTVNWAGGSEVIANGLTVKLASDRTVKVFNGSDQATDAVLDIVGYFIDPRRQARSSTRSHPHGFTIRELPGRGAPRTRLPAAPTGCYRSQTAHSAFPGHRPGRGDRGGLQHLGR